MRTANNLLERLHASFFFYILTTPGTFLTVGSYLPCVLLISIAMMIGGLGEYVRAGWTVDTAASQASSAKQARDFTIEVKWIRRRRPVLAALAIMAASHAAGALLFYTVSKYPSLVSVITSGLELPCSLHSSRHPLHCSGPSLLSRAF